MTLLLSNAQIELKSSNVKLNIWILQFKNIASLFLNKQKQHMVNKQYWDKERIIFIWPCQARCFLGEKMFSHILVNWQKNGVYLNILATTTAIMTDIVEILMLVELLHLSTLQVVTAVLYSCETVV